MSCWEMIVHGRVQGVGFRWFVQDCAKRFGIRGYVQNQSDSTVRILAVGKDAVLASFAEEVKHGNRHAQVRDLTINELTDYSEYEDFFIA
jgi:acylphosphatase